MNLDFAHIYYGSSSCPVQSSDITPLPLVFDFDNAESCARKIFAIMSNASGGHALSNCVLRLHRGRNTANLTAKGVHVYYHDASQPKLSVDGALAMHDEIEKIELGSVVTDQYGGGWQRAHWNAPEAVSQAS
jgi:hypothetical protein